MDSIPFKYTKHIINT